MPSPARGLCVRRPLCVALDDDLVVAHENRHCFRMLIPTALRVSVANDRLDISEIVETMTMRCLLYAGSEDPLPPSCNPVNRFGAIAWATLGTP